MSSEWFNTGTATDAQGNNIPAHVTTTSGIQGYSGQRLPGHSPQWVVHVYGTQTALSTLSGKNGVGKPSDSAIEDMLQNATGLSRTKSEWDRAFTVG